MKWKNLFVAVCLLLGLPAQASEQPELKISVGDWPPYLASNLKHNGVVAHLISDLLADEGYRVSFQFLPWPRAYSAAAAGRLGATAGVVDKNERQADFLFCAALLE